MPLWKAFLRPLLEINCPTLQSRKQVAAPLHQSVGLQRLAQYRSDLKDSHRVVVKLGSAVITRVDECGLALGRLASIVEQISVTFHQGRECILVTSGAVAFGKQKLRHQALMNMSIVQTIHRSQDSAYSRPDIDPRACAATGMSGLMSLYEQLFQQYGIQTAEILLTKSDFMNDNSRVNLRGTINELLRLKIIPIINTNDAVASPPESDSDMQGVISIKDNDSLAARVAAEVKADLLVVMSDVEGLFNMPPEAEGARLLHTYCLTQQETSNVVYGEKSRVGLGGMEWKVKAAEWALSQGVSVVVCKGTTDSALVNILKGQKVGTFFTTTPTEGDPVEKQAVDAGSILAAPSSGTSFAVRSAVMRVEETVVVQGIPSHCALHGNDVADIEKLRKAMGLRTQTRCPSRRLGPSFRRPAEDSGHRRRRRTPDSLRSTR